MDIRRGEIFFANLDPGIGSEQSGIRPVIILQNDQGNKHSPTTIVAPITSRIKKARLPTHVKIKAEDTQLKRDGVVLLEQLKTIDKRRLKEKIGALSDDDLKRIQRAISISLGLEGPAH